MRCTARSPARPPFSLAPLQQPSAHRWQQARRLRGAAEFVARNGYEWIESVDDWPDGDETVKIMLGLAAGQVDEDALTTWVTERIGVEE